MTDQGKKEKEGRKEGNTIYQNVLIRNSQSE